MDADRFQVVPSPFPRDLLPQLTDLFQQEWWSAGRTEEEVDAIVRHSQVNVGFTERSDGRLASYTRVLTDYRTFAVVLDVITRADLRGQGVGGATMDLVFTHPDLQQLRGIGLQCEDDLKPFYARWGFTDAVGRSTQMKRVFDRDAGEAPADAASSSRRGPG